MRARAVHSSRLASARPPFARFTMAAAASSSTSRTARVSPWFKAAVVASFTQFFPRATSFGSWPTRNPNPKVSLPMPDPQKTDPNPFLANLFNSFDPAQPSTPAQAPQPSGPSTMVRVGDQYLNLDPAQLASMKIDPNADMAAIMKYMPQASSGPYSSTPQGEAVTQSQFQQQLNSPFVTPLAQRLGKTHPRLASILDNAMLGATGAEASQERALAAGGGVAGAGSGIASAIAGLTSISQQQLAHRQMLEQLPLDYQQKQAELQQTQAGTLNNIMGALSQYESNPARILSQYGRNYLATSYGSA